MTQRAIVVGDREYPVVPEVRLWTETGLEFRAGEGYNKRRRRDIDLAVYHWQGGEGDPERLFETLQSQDYGVEFSAFRGVIWQYCDPLIVDTADAGIVNKRSVGVEIPNYGYRARGRPIPRKGRGRSTYGCTLRGARRRFAHFWPEDIAAVISLAEALSKALPIPRAVPVDPDFYCILARTMTAEELAAFKGHLGHFHITKRKSDPGFDLLEAMRATWATEL